MIAQGLKHISMKLISQQLALNIMLALLSLVMVFHLSVLTQFIPYTIVWAGKLKTVEEMRQFESVSILLNCFFMTILLLKGNYIKSKIPVKLLNIVLWIFVAIFFLNTVGNLYSETSFELYVFTPMTFVSALLCLRILIPTNRH
jgi:hypothetical protein